MQSPDPTVFAYIHNNPDSQQETVVAPIAEAFARAYDGEVIVAHVGEVRLWLGEHTRVTIAGRDLLPGQVYARMFAGANYDLAVTKTLECLGSRVVNTPASVALAKTKFETAAALAAAGLPVPDQVLFGSEPTDIIQSTHARLGWPRVVKANIGMGGQAVWLAHDGDAVRDLTRLDGPVRPWLAQRFVAEAAGTDIRVLVAGGTVLGAVERRSGSTAEFRANNGLPGGSARTASLTAREHMVAVAAADAVGLTICGVDLLRTNEGPVITEVNSSPSFKLMATTLDRPEIYDQIAAAVLYALSLPPAVS